MNFSSWLKKSGDRDEVSHASTKQFRKALDDLDKALRLIYREFPGVDRELREMQFIDYAKDTPQRIIDQLYRIPEYVDKMNWEEQ